MKSSTGIKFAKDKSKRLAIGFTNNMCPYCGNLMMIDSIKEKGERSRIRFVCRKCKMVLPINHDISNNNETVSPIYDGRVSDFIDNFGIDIEERRNQLFFTTIHTL